MLKFVPRVDGLGSAQITATLLCWSAVPLFLKYFTDYMDGWTANGWRYAISAVFWLPILVYFAQRRRLPGHIWTAALVPTIFNSAGQCCFAWSVYYIEPGLLTFVLRFQLIFVAFAAWVLFPAERRVMRSRAFWVGVTITFVGSVGTCLLGTQWPSGATLWGVLLAVLSGVGFAGYSLSVRHYMHNVPPVQAFSVISLYTAFVLTVVMALCAEEAGLVPLRLSPTLWVYLVASAILGIALAHALYYAGIARLGVAVAAGVIALQPFFTGIGSYVLFHERLTPAQWTSGSLAVVGAVVMLHAQQRSRLRGPVRAEATSRA